jgi:hypothetical protein
MAAHDDVEKVARAIESELSAGRYFAAMYNGRDQDAREALHAASRAAIAALGDGWRDIASAPKTDAANMRALPFLGWCPDRTAPLGGDIRVIWWEPIMQRADETSPRARWFGDRDMEEHPTHWRPLPPPPGAKP